MSDCTGLSRRAFLGAAGSAGVAGWLRAGAPAAAMIAEAASAARAAGAGFSVLGAADAADFDAMAARIIPATDTPGATEAGVVYFIDQAFREAMSDSLPFALEELAALNETLDGRFAEQDTHAQDEILRRIENGPLFELVHIMTIFGFFAMAKYGGNRDHVGWDVIGFEGHKGANEYPFGYYDAAVHQEQADGE